MQGNHLLISTLVLLFSPVFAHEDNSPYELVTLWKERGLQIIDTQKDAQLFSFFIEPEVTRSKFTLFANTTPSDSSCEAVEVKFHLRWRGFPIINPQNATLDPERYFLMDKEHQYQINLTSHTQSSAQVKEQELILVNPLPGDWYASAYIDSKDDRIQQKGLFKACTTKLTVAMSIKRLKLTNRSKLSLLRVNHVTQLDIIDKSTNYFKFVLPSVDSLRDKVTIKVSDCYLGESKFEKCPVKLYIRRYGLPCKDVYHGNFKTGANDDFIDCSLSNDCLFSSFDVAKQSESANYGQPSANYLSIDYVEGNRGVTPSLELPLKLRLSIHSAPNCAPITLSPPQSPSYIRSTESSKILTTDSSDATYSTSATDTNDITNSNESNGAESFPSSPFSVPDAPIATQSPPPPPPPLPEPSTTSTEASTTLAKGEEVTESTASSTILSEASSIESEISTQSAEDTSASSSTVNNIVSTGSYDTTNTLKVDSALTDLIFSDPYNSYHTYSYLSVESGSSLLKSPYSSAYSASSIPLSENDSNTFCPVNLHVERHIDSAGTNLKFVTDSQTPQSIHHSIVSHASESASIHNESLLSIATSDAKSSRMTLISFVINPLIDSGNILTVELALPVTINTTQHNISAEACLSYERIPLDMTDCGKKIHVNSSIIPTSHVITRQFTYTRVPFPSAGIYYLSLKATCYTERADTSESSAAAVTTVPCLHNETLVRLSIKSIGCDVTCLNNGGKCVRYFAPSAPHLTFSQCQCRNRQKGWSCEDTSASDPPEVVWRNFYLIIASNVFLLPCALLALVKRGYVEALVYTVTMFSSGFYHACDTEYVPFCILNLNVLQFADFYGAILTVWVTLVSVASLGDKLKAFLHMLGAIAIVYLVELDKESILTFALPVAVGSVIVLFSWIVRCIKHSICYPSGVLWCCSVFPAVVFASLAICVYSLLETKDNYAITHSIWHVLASIALFFLLIAFPKRARKKGCCSKRNGTEMTGSDTYYELITDEASHLARTHKYSDSGPSTSTVLPP